MEDSNIMKSIGLSISNMKLPGTVDPNKKSFEGESESVASEISAKENEEAFIKRIATVPFLVLDEVGSSTNLKVESEFISMIIRLRYDNGLPTLIATNLDPNNFKLFICGYELNSVKTVELPSFIARLEKENATLNRIKSVAIANVIKGTSHR